MLLIIGGIIREASPKPIINETKDISIYKVIYYDIEIAVDEDKQNFYTIVSGDHNWSGISIDEKELINILSKYKSKRTFQNYFPYESSKIDIRIEIIENHKPKHILLGDFNVWYESADKGSYTILNVQKLREELENIDELKHIKR